MFTPGGGKPGGGTLFVLIKQASCLQNRSSKGLSDPYAKCYLLPDKSVKGKRKTGVIKNNLNPVWEERFTYEKVTLEELSKERVLEVTIWDFNKGSSNERMGGVRLGPAPAKGLKHKEWMDSIGDEVSHWEAMLAHPGEWVDRWHTLRHTMEPRSVNLSVPPSGSTSSFQQPFNKEGAVPMKVEEHSTKMEVVIATSIPLQTNQEITLKEHSVDVKLSGDQSAREVRLGTHRSSEHMDSKQPAKDISQSLAPMSDLAPEGGPTPPVQGKAEPSSNEVSPSVKGKPESSHKDIPLREAEPSPKEISLVKAELSPKEIPLVKAEQSPKEIPLVKAEPFAPVEPEFKRVSKHIQAETEVCEYTCHSCKYSYTIHVHVCIPWLLVVLCSSPGTHCSCCQGNIKTIWQQ